MKKTLIVIMGLCVLLCHTSCKHEKKKEKEDIYYVTTPVRMDTIIKKKYVCQIHSIQHIELRAQEMGYLQNIYVDEGQHVKKGELLFQIMPNLYQAEMSKAEAEVNFAEIEYKNTKKLASQNVVSSNELAMAKAKLAKANAELSLKKVHFQFTQIRAPFDGYIGRFNDVRLGSLIDEGQLLTSLSDNSQMWVYYNVPEAEYLNLNKQISKDNPLEVELEMANTKLFSDKGLVKTIIADFDNETGNIPFRATFPNPNKLLRHGETGNIQMDVPLENVVIIPQKATYEILDKKYVYVVNDENILEARMVETGVEMKNLFVITHGLKTSDKILLEGIRKVKENQEIKYELKDPKKVIAHLDLHAE
ncbi:membrane fusion protein (multidrug efflux system) [Wenyingzhuangia heitensis]|uniref:Membrane fusion protein (Multidrug efflux system) n=1 Tax=Wenyingzhuangia heitensis TaxID=1487859 RepID=A0ABX0U5X9_9FLAO|nr:efflux RND transporter periplasmic adaptor subunit [Wenyingzhuangia heitensis]NIJ43764.1 membrane fusion protein (multidrug efflux system) [Wenyingzhuangia heitensis]